MLLFEKYEGGGNDFLLIEKEVLLPQKIKMLCDRRYGVGADGILIYTPKPSMTFYNADGSWAPMCGNALRCLALLCFKRGWLPNEGVIWTDQGPFRVQKNEQTIAVEMGTWTTKPLSANLGFVQGTLPHLVSFNPDLSLTHEAPLLRKTYDANINKVIKVGEQWVVRTYERGVEGETRACGTGIVASAMALKTLKQVPLPLQLYTQDGHCFTVTEIENTCWLEGPANFVFRGETI